ncbi:hypothetical protein V6Z12_A01G171500 [Gossypium hirsutum]
MCLTIPIPPTKALNQSLIKTVLLKWYYIIIRQCFTWATRHHVLHQILFYKTSCKYIKKSPNNISNMHTIILPISFIKRFIVYQFFKPLLEHGKRKTNDVIRK